MSNINAPASEMSFEDIFDQYVPMNYVVLAFEKMKRMQKSDPNCIPSEIESLIVSVADFCGLLDEEDDSGPEMDPNRETAQSH